MVVERVCWWWGGCSGESVAVLKVDRCVGWRNDIS